MRIDEIPDRVKIEDIPDDVTFEDIGRGITWDDLGAGTWDATVAELTDDEETDDA